MSDLFTLLCTQLGTQPDRRGWVHADCPFCGKEARRGQSHFSFNEEYGHCFVCGQSAGLKQIAGTIGVSSGRAPLRSRKTRTASRPCLWQANPEYYLTRFCEAADRVQAWSQYKPLSLDSISRCRLGVGKLPLWSERTHNWYDYPHRRLIVPVFGADGRCVAFHGRAYLPDDDGPKWLSASGSDKRALFVVGTLAIGCTVVVCENYVDAILAYQVEPSVCYIPIGGLSWQDVWTQHIAAARPKQALVWLDHDLSGNGSRYHEHELLALWRTKIEARRAADPALADRPFPAPPAPRGPQIANDLLAAGVRTRCHVWPKGSPLKADLGWALMQEQVLA